MNRTLILSVLALASFAGCISLKTESEIKPIHITMDVNLKVDKELDKAFAGENKPAPQGDFAVIKKLVDGKRAGIGKDALLAPRPGATDDERITIAEQNMKLLARMKEVAQASGVSLEAVQKRRVAKTREHLPAGCWYETDDGKWTQK